MSLLKIPRRGGWRHRGLGWERRGRGPRALLTPLRPPRTRLRVRLVPLCATAVLTPKGPALGHPRMCREPWQGAPGFQPPCSPCESGPTAPAPQGRGTPAPLAHPSAVPRGHWGAWGGFPGCCSTPELRITLRAPQVVAGGALGTLTHGPLPPTMWGSALWKKPEKNTVPASDVFSGQRRDSPLRWGCCGKQRHSFGENFREIHQKHPASPWGPGSSSGGQQSTELPPCPVLCNVQTPCPGFSPQHGAPSTLPTFFQPKAVCQEELRSPRFSSTEAPGTATRRERTKRQHTLK